MATIFMIYKITFILHFALQIDTHLSTAIQNERI